MRLTTTNPSQIDIFCALACEAKPMIEHFGLKKTLNHGVFETYHLNDIRLTITGVGKVNAAAGVAFSLANHPQDRPPILLNIGIAGHQTTPIGSLFVAEKITDGDTGKNHYPQLLPLAFAATQSLITVSQPSQEYTPNTLYDMEASAFYEIASRFTTSELIATLKIVSDNQQTGLGLINAKQVSEWIKIQLATISNIINCLVQRQPIKREGTLEVFEQFTRSQHFSVTEKLQLKTLLNRWEIVSGNDMLPITPEQFKSTRAFLEELLARIEALPVVV